MKTYVFPFLSAVFLLAGCTAFSDDGTPSVHKGNDSILSFGKLGSATEDAPAGGWVMLGDQYTYVLDKGSSEKLSPIFKAKLKHPYEIKFAYSVKNIKKAGFTVWQEDRRFSTLLCLSYPHADKDEEKTLEKLAFTSSKGEKTPFRCINLDGKIYQPAPAAGSGLPLHVNLDIHTRSSDKNLTIDVPPLSANIRPAMPPVRPLHF